VSKGFLINEPTPSSVKLIGKIRFCILPPVMLGPSNAAVSMRRGAVTVVKSTVNKPVSAKANLSIKRKVAGKSDRVVKLVHLLKA